VTERVRLEVADGERGQLVDQARIVEPLRPLENHLVHGCLQCAAEDQRGELGIERARLALSRAEERGEPFAPSSMVCWVKMRVAAALSCSTKARDRRWRACFLALADARSWREHLERE